MSAEIKEACVSQLMSIAPYTSSSEIKEAALLLGISKVQVYKYLKGKASRIETAIELLNFLAPKAKARKESLKNAIA